MQNAKAGFVRSVHHSAIIYSTRDGMKLSRYICIALAMFANTFAVKAQITHDTIAQHVLHAGQILIQERVYMHFDNTSYYSGDTIWFKAHVTRYNNDKPTTLSRLLYVELLSPEGKVLCRQKKKIESNGTCHGYFELDPLYMSGYFEVRAYTRYMLNWGDESIFSRVFPVFDTPNDWKADEADLMERSRLATPDTAGCKLSLYPEGGHLVYGLESKVAFELTDSKGAWLQEEISLYENDTLLLRSKPVHNGKGIFIFTPAEGSRYTAKVLHDNKKFEFGLPEIEKHGTVISVNNGKNITFTVLSNDTAKQQIGLAVMHRSTLALYRKLRLEGDTVTISPDELPEGVNRAILFRDSIPLAERMFFVHHQVALFGGRQTIKLNANANRESIETFKAEPYEKVTVFVWREDNKPLNEDMEFSVSVTDAERKKDSSWGYNMYSYMLLGSELKGYIPNASQYFDTNNANRKRDLDLIMLTHGWTAFEWKRLAGNDFGGLIMPEIGIVINGAMYRKTTNAENGTITYNNVAKFPSTIELAGGNRKTRFVTDKKGFFELQLREDFYGEREAMITADTKPIRFKNAVYGYRVFEKPGPSARTYSYYEICSSQDSAMTGPSFMGGIQPLALENAEKYDETQEDNRNPAFTTVITGYMAGKKFYSPDYSKITPDVDDFRRTLYWNPEIKPIENGMLKITFYSNAKGGKINVDVLGHTGSTTYSNAPEITTRFISGVKYDEYIAEGYKDGVLVYRPTQDEQELTYCRKKNHEGMVHYNQGEFDVAISCFTELTAYHYPPALTNIGISFMNGAGISRSTRRATLFFKMASEMGEPTAQMHLGAMYAKGIFLQQNDSLALYWYRKSADKGVAESMVAAGRLLMYSDNIEKDIDAAGEYFRNAAIKENAEGLYLYGTYLRKHKRRFRDPILGVADDCIVKAAQLGYNEAENELENDHIKRNRARGGVIIHTQEED